MKFTKRVVERLKLRKLNKLSGQLTLLLNTNAEEIISWTAKMLAAQGWRLIHASEMDELLAQIDKAEEDAAAARKEVETLKSTNISGKADEASEILREFLYGPKGGEE